VAYLAIGISPGLLTASVTAADCGWRDAAGYASNDGGATNFSMCLSASASDCSSTLSTRAGRGKDAPSDMMKDPISNELNIALAGASVSHPY